MGTTRRTRSGDATTGFRNRLSSGMAANPRDWIDVTTGMAPLAAVAVSALALWFSHQQGEQTRKLAERQTRIEEAKLRSDVFQHRFEAWKRLDEAATQYYIDVHGMTEDEWLGGVARYPRFVLRDYNEAAKVIFFLFGDDVNEAVGRLKKSLQTLLTARGATLVKGADRESKAMETFARVNEECTDAIDHVRTTCRPYMLPEALVA